MKAFISEDIPEPLVIHYDPQHGVILAAVNGDLNRKVLSDFYTAAGRIAEKNNCTRILTDLRNARVVATSFELYFEITDLNQKKIHESFRRAIVISQNEEFYGFWENASINLGYENVKVFKDYDEALKWVVI